LQRAHHTAIEIAERNHDAELKTTTDEIYTEMQTCHDFYRMLDDRNYQPDGGESLEQVSSRAKQSLVTLLTQYGKELDEPPQEFLDKKQIDSPNILPEGIPHVVVVSHNGFLAEFYHSMCLWNNTHRMSLSCRYENAAW
jgi:probable phosphoglycerate mutase